VYILPSGAKPLLQVILPLKKIGGIGQVTRMTHLD